MKIDERKGLLHPLRGLLGLRADRPVAGVEEGARDRIDVSIAARELVRLRAVLGPLEPLRPERVSELRVAVATGTYQADPPAVARQLLRDVLGELLA